MLNLFLNSLMILGSILMLLGANLIGLADNKSIWLLSIPIHIGVILVLTVMFIQMRRFKLL